MYEGTEDFGIKGSHCYLKASYDTFQKQNFVQTNDREISERPKKCVLQSEQEGQSAQ